MTLEEYIETQINWSEQTFGPGLRQEGVIDHIHKEIEEIETAEVEDSLLALSPWKESFGLVALNIPKAAEEWIDVVILGLDGLWRSIENGREHLHPSITASIAEKMLQMKQEINKNRKWPDWRTAEDGKAIEHIRGEEG